MKGSELKELAAEVEDVESRQYVADVQRHMSEALLHLIGAADSADIDRLRPALASEQAAYQARRRESRQAVSANRY